MSAWCWYVLWFFFSSRRRHTRFDCDWSSDVCSSDLGGGGGEVQRGDGADDEGDRRLERRRQVGERPALDPLGLARGAGDRRDGRLRGERSEERRVGKEGRARWAAGC